MAQLNKPHQVQSGVRLYHSQRQNPCYFKENEVRTFWRSFPFANFVVMYLAPTD